MMKKYIQSLVHGDIVCFKPSHMGETANFVRLCYAPGAKEPTSLLVDIGGREKHVPVSKIIRCCHVCGCTEENACFGSCSWVDIKSCSECKHPKKRRRA